MYHRPLLPRFGLVFSLALLLLLHHSWIAAAASTPVQFCKDDFCFAVSSYANASSSSTDLYITLKTNRFVASLKGWTAVGLGSQMDGALMFIIYGDPLDMHARVTTSVRTAMGHHQPTNNLTVVTQGRPMPYTDVVKALWGKPGGMPTTSSKKPTHLATSHIVCYSCGTWPGTEVNPLSASQPFVWAFNPDQNLDGHYRADVDLEMHGYDSGFGVFWADLAASRIDSSTSESSTGAAPFPDIDSTVLMIGATESPPTLSDVAAPPPSSAPPASGSLLGKSIRDWMWHLHGFFMSVAFLALYPLGAFLIRAGHPNSFNSHWTTQAFASVLVFVGVVIGVMQSKKISLVHQYVGLAASASIAGQLLLGWRHHVKYIAGARGGTWLSVVHVWLGRALMVAGYANLITGLLLRGYGRLTIVAAGAFIVIEVVLMFWLMRRLLLRNDAAKSRAPPGSRPQDRAAPAGMGNDGEEYFQLVGDDDDDEDDEDRLSDNIGRDLDPDKAAAEKRDQAKKLARLDIV